MNRGESEVYPTTHKTQFLCDQFQLPQCHSATVIRLPLQKPVRLCFLVSLIVVMSFFFGATLKKSNPSKVFAPQSKPKAAPATGPSSAPSASVSSSTNLPQSQTSAPGNEAEKAPVESSVPAQIRQEHQSTVVNNKPTNLADTAPRPVTVSGGRPLLKPVSASVLAVAGMSSDNDTEQTTQLRKRSADDISTSVQPPTTAEPMTTSTKPPSSTKKAPSVRKRPKPKASTPSVSILDSTLSTSELPKVKQRRIFPQSYGDIPSFSRYTVYVRLPVGEGLSGIEGLTLANIEGRAVVQTIHNPALYPESVQRYLAQIHVYDVIVSVNHLDARFASFEQVLRTLTRTTSQTTDVAGIGSSVWSLQQAQQPTLPMSSTSSSRSNLRNAVVDAIACVVFARPPPDVVQQLLLSSEPNLDLSRTTTQLDTVHSLSAFG